MSATTQDMLAMACNGNIGALSILGHIYTIRGDAIQPVLIRFINQEANGSVIYLHAKDACEGDYDKIWEDYLEWLLRPTSDEPLFSIFVATKYPALKPEIDFEEDRDAPTPLDP